MAALTFYNNIPTASQRLRDSQPQFLTNFASLQTFLETNHTAFSDGDSGKHKFLQIPEESSAPTTAANEMGIYTKQGSLNSVSELFVRRESDGTELNLTELAATAPGYCRLGGQILVKWGYDTATSQAFKNITFPVSATIPVFTSTPFHLMVSPTFQTGAGTDSTNPRSVLSTSGPNSAAAHLLSTTGFTIYQKAIIGSPSNITFFWIALGVG